jgi:AraC-like DNA-binding protein
MPREQHETFTQTVHIFDCPELEERGDLHLQTLGVFQSLGGFHWKQRFHRLCIHFVEEGRGTAMVDGVEYGMSAGDIMAFRPGQYVEYFDAPGAPWRYLWCVIVGDGLDWAMRQVGFSESNFSKRAPEIDRLQNYINRVRAVFEARRATPLFQAAAAWRILSLCGEEGGGPSVPIREQPVAGGVKALIDANYMNPLNLDAMAAELCVSRSTLYRSFGTAYGVTPNSYLAEVRIQHAKELLRQSRLGLAAIAGACGFNSVYYFSRAFHKAVGMPPGRWRQHDC